MKPRSEDDFASRLVELALREDPGYPLGAGFAAKQLRPALTSVLPVLAHALAPWEVIRWDLLGGAGGVLLLIAIAEKLAATRWRHLLPG